MKKFDSLMVLTKLDEKDTEWVINYCNEELKDNRGNTRAYILMARAYVLKKDYQLALHVLEMSPELSREVMEEQIEIYGKMKEFESALYVCDKALETNSKDIDLLFTKCILLYTNRMFYESLELIEKVIDLDVNNLYQYEIKELTKEILTWL
jgi:tetratricopeptide (TPR) repeat protein